MCPCNKDLSVLLQPRDRYPFELIPVENKENKEPECGLVVHSKGQGLLGQLVHTERAATLRREEHNQVSPVVDAQSQQKKHETGPQRTWRSNRENGELKDTPEPWELLCAGFPHYGAACRLREHGDVRDVLGVLEVALVAIVLRVLVP